MFLKHNKFPKIVITFSAWNVEKCFINIMNVKEIFLHFLLGLLVGVSIVSVVNSNQKIGRWKAAAECGYSSKIKTNIKMHVESKHNVPAEFHCPICQFYCPNRKSLKNHLDRKHGKEKK